MKQTTSPSKIQQFAETHGADFSAQRIGNQYSVECWSPKGKRWANHATHFVALEGDGYWTTPEWQKTMNDLTIEIVAGFEDCDDPDCDVCHEMSEGAGA